MEAIVCSSAKHNGVFVLDSVTGGSLASYKNNLCSSGGLALVRSRAFDGSDAAGYLVGAQRNSQWLHFWSWPTGRDTPHLRCAAPEVLRCVAASSDGLYVAAGGASSGRLYVWEVATGALLRGWEGHYRPVTALCFTDDDSHLISGGAEAIIHAWRLGDIVDEELASGAGAGDDTVTPATSWHEHYLPITALTVGTGGARGRIFSTSLDRSCRVWEIGCAASLYSVELPTEATAVAVDALERRVFIGGADGRIFDVDLCAGAAAATAARLVQDAQRVEGARQRGRLDAVAMGRGAGGVGGGGGGAGASAMASGGGGGVGIGEGEGEGEGVDEETMVQGFLGHSTRVCALRVSRDGGTLVSAAVGGGLRVWDTESRQTLHALAPGKNLARDGAGAKKKSGAGEAPTAAGAKGGTALLLLPFPSTDVAKRRRCGGTALQPLKKYRVPPSDAALSVVASVVLADCDPEDVARLPKRARAAAADAAAAPLAAAAAAGADGGGAPTMSASSGDGSAAAAVGAAEGAAEASLEALRAENAKLKSDNDRLLKIANQLAMKAK